jgi:hypothetical protein
VLADSESETLWPLWHEWTVASADGTQVPSPVRAGVSLEALSEVEQFCTEKREFLTLQGFSVATEVKSQRGRRLLNGFEWSLGFDEEQGIVSIGYLRQHFTILADEWEAYAHWSEVVQLIYRTWHPIYGYALDPRGGERDTPRKAILAHQISYLYDINLFGPQIVEALDRDRVESAPAQIVTPLDLILTHKLKSPRSGGRFVRRSLTKRGGKRERNLYGQLG